MNFEVTAHNDTQFESMVIKSVEEQIISDVETESVYEEINDHYSDDYFAPKSRKRVKKDVFLEKKGKKVVVIMCLHNQVLMCLIRE